MLTYRFVLVARLPRYWLSFVVNYAERSGGISSRSLEIPPNRVIGSGTMLDSARFRTPLGLRFGVDPHHVHAYVVGEYGDSEVLTWPLAAIAGTRLDEFAVRHGDTPLTDNERNNIDEKVRRAAYEIIAGKGATYYGIGGAVARLLDVLLHDQREILTICTRVPDLFGNQNVTLGLPHLVGAEGALSRIPLRLDPAEQRHLERSASIMYDAIESLKF